MLGSLFESITDLTETQEYLLLVTATENREIWLALIINFKKNSRCCYQYHYITSHVPKLTKNDLMASQMVRTILCYTCAMAAGRTAKQPGGSYTAGP